MTPRGPMLTAKRAREVFAYNRVTGIVRWRSGPRAGKRAGTIAVHGRGKRRVRQLFVDGRSYLEHRVIWLMETGAWPRDQIDHANQKGLDNRWANLREATPSQNQRNTRVHRDNKAGLKWVRTTKPGKYQASVYVTLGVFRTPMAAHLAAAAFVRSIRKDGRFFNDGRQTPAAGARV